MAPPPEWTDPGAFEVSAGVHRIPLPLPQDGLRAVNVYAIESSEELVLVDAGWAITESRRRLDEALRQLGRRSSEVGRFLVTHIHRDHYTQAVAMRREFGAKVFLGVGERASVEALNDPNRDPEAAHLCHLRRCGAEEVVRELVASGYGSDSDASDWEPPDEWLAGETTLQMEGRDLVTVSTPGHTQGHIVFADEENGLLFAGDHVLPHITPSIGFEAVQPALPLGDYLRSLSTVRRMPDMRLLPAHGPVAPSVHARVDELLAHHDQRLDACLAVTQAGPDTAYEVARALPWTRRGRDFGDLDPFNQMLATSETAAHLDLLVAQGRLESFRSDKVVRYVPVG